jgi:STE24 endopeptidase
LSARRRLAWVAAGVALLVACTLAGIALWESRVPDGLHLQADESRYFGQSFLAQAREHERVLRVITLLSVVALVATLAVYARRGAALTRESAAGRVGTGMLLAMLGFAIVWLVQLPFGVAALWWERKEGVSKVGYLDLVVGSFLGLGGEFLFVCLAIAIVMGLAGLMRDWWWVLGAPVFVGLALLASFTSPFLLGDLKPLKDDRLQARADELAREQGLPDIPVEVEEAKELTDAPNAEAVGLGSTRRVILWDTLVDGGFKRPEIEFVLAHEFAHHSREHLWKLLGWFAVIALPVAFTIALVTRRRGGMRAPEAVPLALFALVVLQLVITPAQNAVVRHLEGEADWVALGTTCRPQAARDSLARLARKSLSDPDPPAWSTFLLDTHPPIVDRIAMASAWERRQPPGKVACGQAQRPNTREGS